MKKIFRLSVSILLSAIILLGGSGLIIGKMVCVHSGNVELFAKEAKDCCNDNSSETKIKGACCEIANIVFTPNHFVPASPLSLKSPIAVHLDFIPVFTSPAFTAVALVQKKLNYTDPPLDHNASTALSLLGVFRI